ncbi:hypothetical protein H5410_042199 [Solanum commersonii]|uniref:Uncharacterized protein n=1 Tax=Solanum commersonii TaxID=4109 RepID=A0A9J5XV19_SOLCO|nr:hypothetical protein H5410_042199 [Solanum commersonii]
MRPEKLVLTGNPTHFKGQASTKADLIFSQKFSWTSVNTFAIEPVGPDGKIDPFSSLSQRTNQPIFKVKRAPNWFRRANRPIFKVKQAPEQTLVVEPVGSDREIIPFSGSNESEHVIQNSDVTFTKKFYGGSLRPFLLSQLVPTGKPTHFQGETSPRAGKLQFLPIFRSRWANRPIFKIKRSRVDISYCANLTRRENRPYLKVKRSPKQENPPPLSKFSTLAIDLVGPDWQTDPFTRSYDP